LLIFPSGLIPSRSRAAILRRLPTFLGSIIVFSWFCAFRRRKVAFPRSLQRFPTWPLGALLFHEGYLILEPKHVPPQLLDHLARFPSSPVRRFPKMVECHPLAVDASPQAAYFRVLRVQPATDCEDFPMYRDRHLPFLLRSSSQ
jgi:hypothetical protein